MRGEGIPDRFKSEPPLERLSKQDGLCPRYDDFQLSR